MKCKVRAYLDSGFAGTIMFLTLGELIPILKAGHIGELIAYGHTIVNAGGPEVSPTVVYLDITTYGGE